MRKKLLTLWLLLVLALGTLSACGETENTQPSINVPGQGDEEDDGGENEGGGGENEGDEDD
jgi:hypothetical protein